jgi:hypothetical protein
MRGGDVESWTLTSRALRNCRVAALAGTRSACLGVRTSQNQHRRHMTTTHALPVADVQPLRAIASDLEREAVLARFGEQLGSRGALCGNFTRRGKRHGVQRWRRSVQLQTRRSWDTDGASDFRRGGKFVGDRIASIRRVTNSRALGRGCHCA